MKVEELMVGDWVYAIDANGEKHPCRANNLEYDYTNKCGDFCVDFYGTGYEAEWPDVSFNVEPIPLTPEILEKNGFVMDERDGVAVRYSFATDLNKPKQTVIQFAFYGRGVSADTLFKCWTSPKDCDGINDLHICDLKFIHELQHALRLCGIEKEIIL